MIDSQIISYLHQKIKHSYFRITTSIVDNFKVA